MKRIPILMLAGFLHIDSALSEDSHATMPASASETRTLSSTEQWLELQRSGKSASSRAQPLSGEVMDKVHKRYIKSFEKPIPEFFEHETRVAR